MDPIELLQEVEQVLSNLISDEAVDFGFGKTRNQVIQFREKVRKYLIQTETNNQEDFLEPILPR